MGHVTAGGPQTARTLANEDDERRADVARQMGLPHQTVLPDLHFHSYHSSQMIVFHGYNPAGGYDISTLRINSSADRRRVLRA
jgi:hypothetical protein